MTSDIINIGAIFAEFPNMTRNSIVNKTEFNGATGCWLFNGSSTSGYGEIIVQGKKELLHRVVAHLMYDYNMYSPLQVLHQRFCPNRNCWNWNHLYIGTQKENVQDIVAVGKHPNAIKTHCSQGHPYDEVNTLYAKNGSRQCKICNKVRSKKYLKEAKELRHFIKFGTFE